MYPILLKIGPLVIHTYGVMVAAHGDGVAAVPLEDVAGRRNIVPADHPWIRAARHTNTCLGD